jgi:hypothetical protein
MTSETIRRRGQSISQRKVEIRKAVDTVDKFLVVGKVKAVVDKATGAPPSRGFRSTSATT